ncbi:ABC transporter permease [Timonella senegalensis]|uniref:ABC transporter permease n=1 Tax=Timonella senegalensis TaxID=1465825 RepID=UPI0028A5A302|nr:ABC transporter permease [Timonella senegalensis]
MSVSSEHAPAPEAKAPEKGAAPSRWTTALRDIASSSATVIIFAILGALILAAVLIAAADPTVQKTAGYIFARPADFFKAVWDSVSGAYSALFRGAIYNPDAATFARKIKPITETLTAATPLIFAGLGLGIGFRSGIFNIGAQGQVVLGAVVSAYFGFAFNLPVVLHLIVAIIGGFLAGGLWAGIAGFLKARFGANEVIVTIMLNSIAGFLMSYLLTTTAFMRPGSNNPVSQRVADTAMFPKLFGQDFRLHWGFVLALLAAVAVWWLMERSVLGYRFRAVGFNPDAARTAGIKVERMYLYVMLVAGGLAGMGGVSQTLGTEGVLQEGVAGSIGFDAITVALLGRSRPAGIVGAAILFGALRAGSPLMQTDSNTPIDIVQVVQALVVLLIAAPPLVRAIFRLPVPLKEVAA